MTHFEDGPASGVQLMLTRAPLFLRLVRDAEGKWDALDQLDDRARPEESLHAYRLAKASGFVHVCGRGRGAVSGRFAIATYRFILDRPPEATMRDNEAWRQWAVAQAKEGK
jgi:hypothetical protein